jgi:uncharacterized protein (DUF1330 family)
VATVSKGYWVVSITVTDEAPYKSYVAANAAIFERWGGRFVVRGGKYETVQGTAGTRQVVLEFASYETALACYRSAEYQQALQLLLAGATIQQMVIVEGSP